MISALWFLKASSTVAAESVPPATDRRRPPLMPAACAAFSASAALTAVPSRLEHRLLARQTDRDVLRPHRPHRSPGWLQGLDADGRTCFPHRPPDRRPSAWASREALGVLGFARARTVRTVWTVAPLRFWRAGDPDDPGPCPSLPAEVDLDADLAQERCRTAESSRQRPRAIRPGLFGGALADLLARASRRSEAVPVHTVRVAISARTAEATGSASITLSTASARLEQ